ncbi:MAG: hypothetical protein AAF567_04400 [Actinomycetota bacterium]
MRLRALKAKHGDAIILESGAATVLIDGGPSGTYKLSLRDALTRLPRDGHIDLMMVSHIDGDHIVGILDMTAEMIEARNDDKTPLVTIGDAWHNSFSDLLADAAASTGETEASAASTASTVTDLMISEDESSLVLSSVSQGRRLRDDLETLAVDTNRRFKGGHAIQGARRREWKKGGLSVSVIGPTQEEIDDLRVRWKRDLKKILDKENPARTEAASGIDRSVTNLASLVCIAEDDDARVLLTGDARSDMILDWLRAVGELNDIVESGGDAGATVHFDVLKLPHHGSARNVTAEFFEKVRADHYVVSGDGGHGNPDPAALTYLFETRPELDFTLHMTYTQDEISQNTTYKKKKRDIALERVLSVGNRRSVIRTPAPGAAFLDVEIGGTVEIAG